MGIAVRCYSLPLATLEENYDDATQCREECSEWDADLQILAIGHKSVRP